MPRENTIKRFEEDAHYHVYNRGNNKQEIFFEEKDYWVFRRMVKKAINRVDDKIFVNAFALLPNHFHLLIHQTDARIVTTFMKSLSGRYARYISKKYNRSGTLFSGIYRGILLEDELHIKQIKKYILSNPFDAGYPEWKHVGVKL